MSCGSHDYSTSYIATDTFDTNITFSFIKYFKINFYYAIPVRKSGRKRSPFRTTIIHLIKPRYI